MGLMARSRDDFMFCDLCGTMLSMESTRSVVCSLCKLKKSAQDFVRKEISYKVTAEDVRKDLGISNFERNVEVQDMEIFKKCEKCNHPKLRFYSKQMRSADEGQTTFFTCPNCSHTFTEN